MVLRAVQNRTKIARAKIIDGAMAVLAEAGVPGLTHRAVATAAGVSLAATTYHFDTKAHIVEEASRTLLDGYLGAFRQMAVRIEAGEEKLTTSLDDLVLRVVTNALGRERIRSLAWCELILHGGRTSGGQKLARHWYQQLDEIWSEIADRIEPGASRYQVSAAVDITVGLTFVLHPLRVDPRIAKDLLAGTRNFEGFLGRLARSGSRAAPPDPAEGGRAARRYFDTRQRILQAVIDLIVEEGASGVSYRRVAEIAGMVRSGPSYYFPTIEGLLETAQISLFERAKARYRAGLSSASAIGIDEARLLDLTTTIYLREALEFPRENIGYYSVWLAAANNAALRPVVASSVLDLHRAWSRRIESVTGASTAPGAVLRIQALFIGKLVRAIVASPDLSNLSHAREDFSAALKSCVRVP